MKTKELSLNALFIALIVIATAFIHVPSGLSNGYIHVGDSMIFLALMFLPSYKGVFVGGLGSMLSDLVAGYAYFAPLTFVVQLLMGLVFFLIVKQEPHHFPSRLIACICAGTVMVIGYCIGEYFMYSSWGIALSAIVPNMIQVVGSTLIFELVYNVIKRQNILK